MEAIKNVTGIDKAVAEITTALSAQKDRVISLLAPYITGVVTEDTLPAWKKDRAMINKEKTATKNERIALEKEWAAKIQPVSAAYKDIDGEYQKALDNIDKQTKEFEEERKKIRIQNAREIFERIHESQENGNWLTFDEVYDPKFFNASTSNSAIETVINERYTMIDMGILTIKSMKHKYEEQGLAYFRTTKDINGAVRKMVELSEQEEIIERRKQKEAEEQKTAIDIDPIDEEPAFALPDETIDDLPEDVPKHIRLLLEIRESDLDRLLKLLDDDGIYYTIY